MKKAQLITPYPLEDVTVLGITAVLKPHKLAWLINRMGSLKLSQTTDRHNDITKQANNDLLHFSFETEHCTFRLVKNGVLSHEGVLAGYLVPALRQFDFFFITQDFTQTFQVEAFCKALRATKQVAYVASLPKERWHQTDLLKLLGS